MRNLRLSRLVTCPLLSALDSELIFSQCFLPCRNTGEQVSLRRAAIFVTADLQLCPPSLAIPTQELSGSPGALCAQYFLVTFLGIARTVWKRWQWAGVGF